MEKSKNMGKTVTIAAVTIATTAFVSQNQLVASADETTKKTNTESSVV